MSEARTGRLANKIAVITGAATGIGRATAIISAREGAKVIIGDIDSVQAEETVAMIRAAGGEAMQVFCDASEEESIAALIDQARRRYGRLDVLYNNAGGSHPSYDGLVANITNETFDRMLALNLKGPTWGCKHAIPLMLEGGGGAIVNTASMAAVAGNMWLSAYSAAKAGVIQLTRMVATQYGKQNIRCNGVAPAYVLSPGSERAVPEHLRAINEMHLLVPKAGRPEDVGHVAAFLASDEAAYVTGQTIHVDGGFYAHLPTASHMRE